jgi:hypothetical protein
LSSPPLPSQACTEPLLNYSVLHTGGGDICLTNGLCQNGGNYYRDFCADPTWKSPNCLSKDTCGDCDYVQLTLCSDGSWCCGVGNYTACCNAGLGFQLAENLVEFVTSGTSVSPSVTAGPITTVTAITTAIATASEKSQWIFYSPILLNCRINVKLWYSLLILPHQLTFGDKSPNNQEFSSI